MMMMMMMMISILLYIYEKGRRGCCGYHLDLEVTFVDL